ncbi:MAG: sulfatase [Cyclobacteriaceae bacterium]
MANLSMIQKLRYCSLCWMVLGVMSCAQKKQPPNMLFIMSDDHTSQSWGIYGSVLDEVAHTPNIKRLRSEGAQLMNVFATNSICVPSRAAILTGEYSHRNGVYTLSDAIDPDRETVAKILQQKGYETAIFGKWHLKTQPQGFDAWNVLPGQGRYFDPVLRNSENWPDGETYEGFSSDVITDQSLAWLEQRDKEKPFFLMHHFKATHEPFNYPDRLKDLYEDVEFPEPESLMDFYPDGTSRTFQGQILDIMEERFTNNPDRYLMDSFSTEGLTREEARRKVYQQFIRNFLRSGAAIDENIGRVLDYLDKEGLRENTIVIYTADQGYFLGEHGLFDKRMMYEESIRMPFVISYPPEIEAGSTNEDLILNVDFAPLFLDYAGVEVPDFMQGRSFRANLTGETPEDWRESFYYRYWLHETHRPAHLGVRTKEDKLIYFYGQDLIDQNSEATAPTWEYYDLKKDPKEINNVFGDPEYQDQIKSLKQEIIRLKGEAQDSDEQYPGMDSLLKALN